MVKIRVHPCLSVCPKIFVIFVIFVFKTTTIRMVKSVFICEYLWDNKNNYPWEEISDPLYLPLKRGGLVCLPLESPYDIQ